VVGPQINLDVPSNRVALSNMNVVRTTPTEDGTRQLVEFAPSPIMSTYLVAFVVGELDYIEDTTSLGIKVRPSMRVENSLAWTWRDGGPMRS